MFCERDRCPVCGNLAQLVEKNSRTFDPDRAGIGSSALLGARYNTYMPVPQAPTTVRTRRYLFHLAQMEVPQGYRGTLSSVWQGLYIGAYPDVGAGDDLTKQLVPCQVTDPMFAFPDGNTNWSMVWRPGRTFNDSRFDPVSQPGMYAGLRATDSSLLYLPPLATGYFPPNAGDPSGTAVGSLTGFTHLRFPPSGMALDSLYQFDGPGTLAFLVSVWQTDPATRLIWTPPVEADLGAFSREQRFIWQMKADRSADGEARYTHVAGGFIAQTRPLCCEQPRPGALYLPEADLRTSARPS